MQVPRSPLLVIKREVVLRSENLLLLITVVVSSPATRLRLLGHVNHDTTIVELAQTEIGSVATPSTVEEKLISVVALSPRALIVLEVRVIAGFIILLKASSGLIIAQELLTIALLVHRSLIKKVVLLRGMILGLPLLLLSANNWILLDEHLRWLIRVIRLGWGETRLPDGCRRGPILALVSIATAVRCQAGLPK